MGNELIPTAKIIDFPSPAIPVTIGSTLRWHLVVEEDEVGVLEFRVLHHTDSRDGRAEVISALQQIIEMLEKYDG